MLGLYVYSSTLSLSYFLGWQRTEPRAFPVLSTRQMLDHLHPSPVDLNKDGKYRSFLILVCTAGSEQKLCVYYSNSFHSRSRQVMCTCPYLITRQTRWELHHCTILPREKLLWGSSATLPTSFVSLLVTAPVFISCHRPRELNFDFVSSRNVPAKCSTETPYRVRWLGEQWMKQSKLGDDARKLSPHHRMQNAYNCLSLSFFISHLISSRGHAYCSHTAARRQWAMTTQETLAFL